MSILSRSLIAAIAVFSTSVAFARDFYTVRVELTREGIVIAQPTLIVAEGQDSVITVSGGSNSYELKLKVTALPENQVKLETNIQTEHGGFNPSFVSRDGDAVEFAMNQYRGKFVVSKNRT